MDTRIKIVTVPEVAAVLKLKETTVCSLASRGKIPGFKVGKSWRFDMGKVERLFSETPDGGNDHHAGDQEKSREEGG